MFPPQIFQLTSGPLESQAAEPVTKLRVGPGPVQHYHDSCVLQGVPKNVVSLKNGHIYLQAHSKCKCWGCFGKFREVATIWALTLAKLKKKSRSFFWDTL